VPAASSVGHWLLVLRGRGRSCFFPLEPWKRPEQPKRLSRAYRLPRSFTWEYRRNAFEDRMTARNVFECIRFALLQDRICSIDEIVLSNNNGRD
jgi:hypothetical protein